MSAARLEAFLAQLYVDEQARRRFLSNPHDEAANAGLSEQDCTALANIDLVGLEFAADSLAQEARRSGSEKNHPDGCHGGFAETDYALET